MMTKTYLNQILSKHLLTRETCDCSRLVVPLVHEPVRVNAEDGRVGSVDEGLQLLSDAGLLNLYLLAFSDVLSHAYHPNDGSTDISTSCSIEKHLDSLTILCVERKFKVGCLATLKGVI